MIRLLLAVSLLLICSKADAQIQSGLEYDVYFLAGQSNGSGRGDASQIPAGSPLANPQTDVQFYWRKTLVTTNGNLTQNTFVPLQPDSGHGRNNPGSFPVEFGPELGMGRTLADLFPTRNILIIKYSHGGSNLHTDWAAGGTRYNTFISTVNDALADITAAGATFQLRGIVWVQGEADAGNATNAGNYGTNLTDLISRMRTAVFAGAEAPFVLSRLSDNQYPTLSSNVQTVRTAQQQTAEAMANVEWVDADDAEFSTYSGTVHFNAAGITNLGNALGEQVAALEEDPGPAPEGQTTYSISAETDFGDNGANAGTMGPSFTDNSDGTFTLANGADSGANNAVFINSSDGGSVRTRLGRALTSEDVVTVSGTVSSATVNYNANGVEFGLQSAAGFRSAPNLLLQVDDNGNRGGFAPFFGTPLPGANVNRTQTPGATEESLNDGYSFVATYTATDIVFTLSDIVTVNATGSEPVGATSFSYSFTDAVAADASLQGALDDYIANYSTLVGNSFGYFSFQKTGSGNSTTISDFSVVVTEPGVLLGDVNLSGFVDFDDISPFITLLANGEFQAEADIDGSTVVDFDDIAPFIAILAGP